MEDNGRLTGTVKWFDDAKGYGFIERDDKDGIEDDCFVHFSDIIAEGRKSLLEGDRVEFEIVDGQKGTKAGGVIVI